MSRATKPTVSSRVGVVGAGQLARMMGEASTDAGVTITVLATSLEDPAVATCASVLVGAADDEEALRALARLVDVITFDHELVDLEVLVRLEGDGVALRPNARALRFSVDKAFQRRTFVDAGIAVPRFVITRRSSDHDLTTFLDSLSTPPVVKAARGGYDGRGVRFPATMNEVAPLVDELGERGEVVVEERLALVGEVAHVLARSIDGALTLYPAVTTVQREGICVEVRYPSDLSADLLRELVTTSALVANVVQGVGVMAIEYFVTDGGLLVNEVALRPHNSAHWTIEGTTTSQFTQHLRAVSAQPLGEVHTQSAYAVMVNVIGDERPGSLARAHDVTGIFVHDYGKAWRPGRKLGHVTALGDEPAGPRVRAWDGARAYGTATRET